MADKKFIDAMLKAHNDYRKLHGVPALKINKDLNKMAQKWAEHLAKTNRFEHSRDRIYKSAPVGENLAMKWTSNNEDYRGDEATKQWYDEISQYNFSTSSGPGTGHFTQVVWKDSQELGVGRAQTRDGKWITAANYFPAGNYIGKYAENVLPPGSKPVKHTSKPAPKAASYSTTTTTSPATGSSSKPKSGPKSWFSRSTAPKEVPVVQAREFNPSGSNVIHVGASSRPTFTTTVIEHNSKPTSSSYSSSSSAPHSFATTRGQFYESTGPQMSSQMSGFSKTVVTRTVIGPDGKKTVETREEVRNISGPTAGFSSSQGRWK